MTTRNRKTVTPGYLWLAEYVRLCDDFDLGVNTLIPKGRRGRAWLGFVFQAVASWNTAAGPKRVLLDHSYRSVVRLATLLVWTASALSAYSQTRQIVVLYDERPELPGMAMLDAGFARELTSKSPDRVEIYREAMDLSRFDSDAYRKLLRDELRAKYAAKKIDVVVAVMEPALQFLLNPPNDTFPGAAIVFCGIDRKQLSQHPLPADVTGVLLKREFLPTLELVAGLHPETERIAVVAGASAFDTRLLAQVQEEFRPYEKRFAFTYLTALPLPELLTRVSQLPPKTVVLYSTMFRDGAGQPCVPHEIAERISAVANAPVYGFLDQYMGRGIVGGRLYGMGMHGEEAAGLVLKILSGQKPMELAPIEPVNGVTQFDARQLQRWKISDDRLPAGSTILFRVPAVWDRYRAWIIAGVSVCLFEALLIFVLVANLAKRRRAERSLAESENRFRIAADAAPIMMWMTGIDKQCVFVNKMWLEFTGRTLEQAQGNGWTENVHPDDLPRCLKSYHEAFDERLPFVIEFRLQRHQQEFGWICSSGKPRLDVQGNFVGYIGSCVDVTEARREAEALAESESRLRSILNTAVEGIITINNRGTIESVNAATLKLFGYSSEELVGQNVSILMPRTPTEERDLFPDKTQTNGASSVIGSGREVSAQRKDGSLFPIDLAVSEIKLQGRHVYTGFIRDVTDRKEAERTSQELNQRLIRAQEEERSRLARELHDDITQRLARLAIDAGRAESGMPLAEMAVMMRELREGLSRLSEDVHSLSYKLHPSVLDDLGLADALRAECERFSKREAIASEIALRDVPDALPRDTGLGLFRVTQEALQNVARHAHASSVEVSLTRMDGGLQLAVRDNGSGFEPSLKRERLSLGLASMRERMRLLGGELDIESGPGQGTTIVAWVPVKIGTL